MENFARFLAVSACVMWSGMVSAEMLPGSEWSPTAMNEEVFEAQAEVFLRFEQNGRYFGNGGCNSFRGSFVTNDEAILFSPAAATMMACPEPIAKQEFAFLQALMSVRGFEREGIELSLFDAEGTAVLKMQQRDAD